MEALGETCGECGHSLLVHEPADLGDTFKPCAARVHAHEPGHAMYGGPGRQPVWVQATSTVCPCRRFRSRAEVEEERALIEQTAAINARAREPEVKNE